MSSKEEQHKQIVDDLISIIRARTGTSKEALRTMFSAGAELMALGTIAHTPEARTKLIQSATEYIARVHAEADKWKSERDADRAQS